MERRPVIWRVYVMFVQAFAEIGSIRRGVQRVNTARNVIIVHADESDDEARPPGRESTLRGDGAAADVPIRIGARRNQPALNSRGRASVVRGARERGRRRKERKKRREVAKEGGKTDGDR